MSANPTKWSNTLKIRLPMNCLSVFDHFVGLTLKELSVCQYNSQKCHSTKLGATLLSDNTHRKMAVEIVFHAV